MKQNLALSHGFVSVNGIKLHTVSTGKGPLVLFLHGFPEFWYAWKDVLPAVGVPGVAAWKPYYSKLFNGFDMVYVVGDNDVKEDGTNPGAEFSRRVAGELMNSQIVQLPPGMDITDFYLVNGKEATANLVGGAK